MAIQFSDLMKGFGIVTVMNACIFLPKKAYTAAKNCKSVASKTGYYNDGNSGLAASDFVPAYEYIDTLKIANFTQEGPTKTISGGQYANPLIKYGKTMTAEIQDALGRASTLERFFGVDYDGYAQFTGDGVTKEFEMSILKATTTEPEVAATALIVRVDGVETTATVLDGKFTLDTAPEKDTIITAYAPGSRLSITDKFPGPFAIEGDTFFIDQKTGEKKHVFIFIPQFVPDAIFNLTQDAEGDATVFDLNGSVAVTDIMENGKSRSIFYEIRETSFFAEQRQKMDIE